MSVPSHCLRATRVLRRCALRPTALRAVAHRPQWDALRELRVPLRRTVDGAATLDGTLDLVGYQLFRDGLLEPPRSFGSAGSAAGSAAGSSTGDRASASGAAAAQRMAERVRRSGVVLRRSVKESALVVGCDEAGRGPLAGPVVGAAVCRVPLSSFNNDLLALYDEREQLQVFDSKSVSEAQRRLVFRSVTGRDGLFAIAAEKPFAVHHAAGDSAPDAVFTKRSPAHMRLQRLPFKKILSMQTPHLVSYHGANVSGNYLYLWAIGIANHTYIDTFNIFTASMHTMHRSCLAVWRALNDTRFSQEKAPRPRHCSIAQYLFSRFCIAAAHDDRKRYRVPAHIDLVEGAAEYFDVEPVQPPLILVDGHAVPAESLAVFGDPQTAGCVHPIIEGDKRSFAIAAASCIAKVARDDIMSYLGELYPIYQFAENKGYPVEQHMRAVQRHGVSPIHRKSYKPCSTAITKQLKRKAKEAQSH